MASRFPKSLTLTAEHISLLRDYDDGAFFHLSQNENTPGFVLVSELMALEDPLLVHLLFALSNEHIGIPYADHLRPSLTALGAALNALEAIQNEIKNQLNQKA